MSNAKVVLWHPMYHPVGHTLLAEAVADVVVVDSNDVGEVKQALHGARVLWVRTPERITAEVLDAAKISSPSRLRHSAPTTLISQPQLRAASLSSITVASAVCQCLSMPLCSFWYR